MENQITKSLKAVEEFLNSDEGQEYMENYFEKERQRSALYSKKVENFYLKNKDNMPAVIEKIIAKYESSEYVIKEHNLGYQPREDLYWLLLSVAQTYGIHVNEDDKAYEKLFNMFTGEAYIYEGYFIQVMHGQGSVVHIDKL